MPKFIVRTGRDATIHHKAVIEADSLKAVQEMIGRHGMAVPENTRWEEDGVSEFDDLECVEIYAEGADPDEDDPLYSWEN